MGACHLRAGTTGHAASGTKVRKLSLRLLAAQEDGAFVRVKLLHLESARTKVLALKQDLLYWPTWELRLDPAAAAWRRTMVAPAAKL